MNLERKVINRYLYDRVSDIALDEGVSKKTVLRIIKQLGDYSLYKKLNRFRTINEIQFLSPEGNCYYFLGFVLADGWIRGNHIGIRLSIRDREHIFVIGEFLNYRGNYSISSHIAPNGKEVETIQIDFSSNIISEFLKNHGVSENKTGKEDYYNIPDKYFIDFFRGFMDGDGNIAQRISIYSYSNVVYKIAYDIERLYGIKMVEYNKNQRVNNMTIKIGDVRKLFNILYNGNIYMHRKYQAIKEVVK